MDCRRTLMPAVWLLTGALGCAHDNGGTPPVVRETPPPPLAARANLSPYAPAKHELDGPKRIPRPDTCVQAGNFFVGEAVALEQDSTAQEQMRDQARRAFQQALSIDPTYLPAYQSLARLYVIMGDYDHALATYQKALRLQPRNGPVWFDLGMCQARRRDWPAAIDSLSRAVDCDPENRQYLNTLAFTHARAGRYQDAFKCFVRSYGNEAMAQYQLARMLHHMGQYESCRQCLQAALALNPKLEPAQRLLSELAAPQPTDSAVRTVGYAEEAPVGPELPPAASREIPAETIDNPPTPPGASRGCILPPPPSTGTWRQGQGQ
jgi:tetratricopeptide (TPR) repeat protein